MSGEHVSFALRHHEVAAYAPAGIVWKCGPSTSQDRLAPGSNFRRTPSTALWTDVLNLKITQLQDANREDEEAQAPHSLGVTRVCDSSGATGQEQKLVYTGRRHQSCSRLPLEVLTRGSWG